MTCSRQLHASGAIPTFRSHCPKTFFVKLVPGLEELRKERFQMMVYASRSWHEWADMVPWQRRDFLQRFKKHQEERRKEQEQRNQEMRQSMGKY